MKPLELLKFVSDACSEKNVPYVLCGGIAASLYRDRPRVTNDVDIAISIGEYEDSKEFALSFLREIGAKVSLGWIPQLKEKKINTMALVIGQFSPHDYDATIDILLPNLPWVPNAVIRGAYHIVDFKFASIPTITIEDLVVAKLYALSIEANRFQDLDDLKSIFKENKKMDFLYLSKKMVQHQLKVPDILKEYVPKCIV